jgi:hypothetical protein
MLITKQRYWNVENIHNVLAHELTHSLAALDHDTRGDKLMNTSASNGNFISEKFCEAMQRSPFLR